MAWEGSTRKARLPSDWQRRRLRVLRRDGYRCQAHNPETGGVCGEFAHECDHIERGDDHDESNLQALCRWHHARKTAREAAEARRPRERQQRPAEPHPGLIEPE